MDWATVVSCIGSWLHILKRVFLFITLFSEQVVTSMLLLKELQLLSLYFPTLDFTADSEPSLVY